MRHRLTTGAFVAAVFTLDVGPLAVYRYLLVSDALLLLALLLQVGAAREPILCFPKFITATFALYLGSTVLAFARPDQPAIGVFTWLHSAFLMGVYVPVATTLMTVRPDLRRYVLPVLLVSASFQGAIVTRSVTAGLNWTSGTRIAGAFGSVQLWSYAAAAVAVLALLMTGSRRQKFGALICTFPLLAAEIFLRSRMLWIASFLGACIFGIIQAKRKALAITVALSVLVGLVSGYALDLYPDAVERRISDALRPSEAADLRARMAVVYAAMDAISASPIVGVGTGQAPRYFADLPVPPVVVTAHNILLHAAMEGGLLAAVALGLIPLGIIMLWYRGLTTAPQAERPALNWAFSTLMAVYIAAQLTPTLFEHSFYFLIAFLAAMTTGAPAPARWSAERAPG
jgi:O-Antigen ligase